MILTPKPRHVWFGSSGGWSSAPRSWSASIHFAIGVRLQFLDNLVGERQFFPSADTVAGSNPAGDAITG
jgi:hypothetical protein